MKMSDLFMTCGMFWKFFKSLPDEIYLCVGVTSVLLYARRSRIIVILKIPRSYFSNDENVWVVLDACSVWKVIKSLLDDIYLCVDVTSVFYFDARGHTPWTILEVPWSHFGNHESVCVVLDSSYALKDFQSVVWCHLPIRSCCQCLLSLFNAQR